ncbi:phage Gp37Gp68 domain protein [Bacteroides fragilis str. S36L5]|nr:phage Gp37Gp68 domain protein [Bacteroides fragilis str. S36L5]
MKNLTWQNPEQLFVAQELINKVKSKCCGIKVIQKEDIKDLKK